MDEIDVSQLTLEGVEEHTTKHKDSLHLKVKKLKDLEQQRKDLLAACKEPISLAKEEIKAELEILEELAKRRLELEADKLLK